MGWWLCPSHPTIKWQQLWHQLFMQFSTSFQASWCQDLWVLFAHLTLHSLGWHRSPSLSIYKLSGHLITERLLLHVIQKLPQWWRWYYWLCPTAWTVNGLITSQYADSQKLIEVIVPTGDIANRTISDYLNSTFGFHKDFLGEVAAVLIIFPVFFALVFTICVRALNFQRRWATCKSMTWKWMLIVR